MRPIIINRSVVISIYQVIQKSPEKMVMPGKRQESASERKLVIEKLTRDQMVWSALLDKTCSQQVDWPAYKG
jgi:hypothetical protein